MQASLNLNHRAQDSYLMVDYMSSYDHIILVIIYINSGTWLFPIV